MKAKTRIEAAVKLARAAYCDYARIVLGQPVRTRAPKVVWWGDGWTVDQRRFRGQTAAQVIDYYDDLQRQYHQSIKDYYALPAPTRAEDLDAASDTDVVNITTP